MTDYLRRLVWSFIIEYGICALPVDPLSLARKNGWVVYTYDEFSHIIHPTAYSLLLGHENDGFCFYSRRHQTYFICYNSQRPADVIRWTLAHEIAHIVLGHVGSDDYSETEAEGFCYRLLTPSVVLHACRYWTAAEIARACDIPMERAEVRAQRMAHLEQHKVFGHAPEELVIRRQFDGYIRQHSIQFLRRHMAEFGEEFAREVAA